MSKSKGSDDEATRAWVRASAKAHLASTGDPEYLAKVAEAAAKGGRGAQEMDEVLDAYNKGKAGRA